MPALLRAKVTATDQMSMQLTPGLKTGYMVLDEFSQELGAVTTKVFPSESAAKAYAQGQVVIKVEIIRKFD